MSRSNSDNTNYIDLFINLYKTERGLVEKIILDFFDLRERCIIRSYITPMTRAEMGIMAVDAGDYVFLEELYVKWHIEDSVLGIRFDGFREISGFSSTDYDVEVASTYELPVWDRICETCISRDSFDLGVYLEFFSCSFYLESVLRYKNREIMMAFIRIDGHFDYIGEFFCIASSMTLDIFKWCLEMLKDEMEMGVEPYKLTLCYGDIECVRYYEDTYGYHVSDASGDHLRCVFTRSDGDDVIRHIIRNGYMDEYTIREYCETPSVAKNFHLEGMLPKSFMVTKVGTSEDIDWVIQHGGTFSYSCIYEALCRDKFDMIKDRKEILNFENITNVWNNYGKCGIFDCNLPDDIFMISREDETSSKIIEFQDRHHSRDACHVIRNGFQCNHSRKSGKLFCEKHLPIGLLM